MIVTKTELLGGVILSVLNKPEELGKSKIYLTELGFKTDKLCIIKSDKEVQRILNANR